MRKHKLLKDVSSCLKGVAAHNDGSCLVQLGNSSRYMIFFAVQENKRGRERSCEFSKFVTKIKSY
jgi:hypothetical protein